MSNFILGKILNKKVISIKGLKETKKSKHVPAEFIFFDDGETYIEFEERDCGSDSHCYCSGTYLKVIQDKNSYDALIKVLSDSTYDCWY